MTTSPLRSLISHEVSSPKQSTKTSTSTRCCPSLQGETPSSLGNNCLTCSHQLLVVVVVVVEVVVGVVVVEVVTAALPVSIPILTGNSSVLHLELSFSIFPISTPSRVMTTEPHPSFRHIPSPEESVTRKLNIPNGRHMRSLVTDSESQFVISPFANVLPPPFNNAHSLSEGFSSVVIAATNSYLSSGQLSSARTPCCNFLASSRSKVMTPYSACGTFSGRLERDMSSTPSSPRR
mmetsp:Transcript_19438/g.33146  ORF Transcript_19438/g.33146 Transcript_19438/m.33146 type:complete len:235 (+) Transcript_19438:990-1694(+)